MTQCRIYPYKMGSKGASLLAEALREKGMRTFKVYPNRRYSPQSDHILINWGCSKDPAWLLEHFVNVEGNGRIMMNQPTYVSNASNKLRAFEIMKRSGDVSIPEFTTRGQHVYDSLTAEYTDQWVARTKLRGHSGAGIVLIKGGTEYGPEGDVFPEAPLYVKYIKKTEEYRVHVVNNEVIDVQQKRKRRGVENEQVNYQVRNASNGWVYCRDNVNPDVSVLNNSIAAVSALGLDFGAVDVIWNKYQQMAYVLEVNTAPGLEGTTVSLYTDAFLKMIEGE